MRMPMVDGKETIQVLLKMNPQLPIIGMSGISGLGTAREAGIEARFFLSKPFSAEQLLQILNEALPQAVEAGPDQPGLPS
jgi:DNA-binding NtrC family response regulator